MNRITFRSLLAVPALLVLLCVPSVASADGITWTLSGVTFTDGTAATGSLVFDATTNMILSASIVTTGCPTCVFTTGETYTTQNPGSAPFMPFSIVLVPTGSVSTGTRLLDLELVSPGLTGAVNPVPVDLLDDVAFEGVCGDDACDAAADSPFRSMTAGQLVAPVATPEPSTLLLMGAGLLFLVVATKRLALP
jgi:hypothetical protein